MNEIVTELAKPVWWVSVVIAGIVINLISAYLKLRLDRTLGSASGWWKQRSIARQSAWADRIDRICRSDLERNFEIASEMRQRLQSIHMVLLAMLILLQLVLLQTLSAELSRTVRIGFLGASALLFFGSFLAFQSAARTAGALRAARNQANLPSKRTPDGAA